MSCTICRLPFVPSKMSVDPHPPPKGILDGRQYAYFEKAINISHKQSVKHLEEECLDAHIVKTYEFLRQLRISRFVCEATEKSTH